jgi:hypothetical protein
MVILGPAMAAALGVFTSKPHIHPSTDKCAPANNIA